MIEISRRQPYRSENAGPAKLDLIIMKNLSDALGTSMEQLNVMNGKQSIPDKVETHEIIDEALTTIGYRRVWDASDNEKILAASWLSLEFNLWSKRDFLQESRNELLLSESAEARWLPLPKNSSACPNNANISSDCKPECHLLFPDGDIDNLVSMYGKINHLLKKYRNLSVCLARNRRSLAKELNKILDINSRGKSSLLFDCNFDEILDVIDAAERKGAVQNTNGNRVSLKPEGVKRSNSSSAASVRDRGRPLNSKSTEDCRDSQRSNRIEYTEQKTLQAPTITKALSDKILRELEAKQYRAKKLEIELLRSREAETAYLQSLLNSEGLQKLFRQKVVNGKSDDDDLRGENENGSRGNRIPFGQEHVSKPDSSYPMEDSFKESLKGYDVMAGELEEAVGVILRGGHLSASDMMEIVETADRDWIDYRRDNGMNIGRASVTSSMTSKGEQMLLKSNLSDPLFRSYQRIFSYPLHSKNDEYDHLRSQHSDILKRTAAVCEPFSPFNFVFYD